MTVLIKLTLPDADTALLRGAAALCNMSLERFMVEAAEEKARKMRLLMPSADRPRHRVDGKRKRRRETV